MPLIIAKDFFKGPPKLALRMSHSFNVSPIFSSAAWFVLLVLAFAAYAVDGASSPGASFDLEFFLLLD